MSAGGEEWRPIPRFQGRYEVSNQGRVRSVDWVVEGLARSTQLVKGRVLTPGTSDKGYLGVRLVDPDKGRARIFKVHRLVLEAFIGPCPEGMEACHGDGDRANNAVGNLRWDTRSSNFLDKRQHGTDVNRNKTACPRGHLLVAPNLDESVLRRGYRGCKACARARSWAHRRPDRDFVERADHLYARMMGAHHAERQ